MKRLTLLFIGLAISGPSVALAQESAPQPGYKPTGEPITNPAEPGYDPELMVCREWIKTGTRAKRREVCLSNKRWAMAARDGNALANRIVEDGRAGGMVF